MKYRDPITKQFKELTVKVSDTLPIGTIVGYAGATAPDGWLICDGSAISRSLYSALFSAIGATYGAGDGSTTFNIPDYRDRVPVGLDTNDSDFNVLGKTLGEKEHTLTIEETPIHRHVMTLGIANPSGSGWYSADLLGSDGQAKQVEDWQGRTTENAGGGQPHNIIQPSIVTNYIIKASQPIAVPGKIVNSYSTNPDNAYNTTYVNGKYDEVMGIMESAAIGKILWTNPKPTENFIQQDITLNSNDYDVLEVWFSHYRGDNYSFSQRFLKGTNTDLFKSDKDGASQSRTITYISDTQLSFGDGYFYHPSYSDGARVQNSRCVPIYIIGYKTGLFD